MAGPTLAFGKHSSGKILHISEAAPGGDCHCICPECDLPLVAKKGHVTPHFAHHPDGGGGTEGCGTTGQMTALHTFARDLFLSGGYVRLPSAARDGHRAVDPAEVELTDVRTEQRFEGHQPDVIGRATDGPLLIEIVVTNRVSDQKTALIRRQRLESLEIVISRDSVSGKLSLAAVEDHVRRGAKRHWIFNEKLENFLHARYHLDGVRPRGRLTTDKSRALARLYDRLAGLPKVSTPSPNKTSLSQWLEGTRPSFEGYFRTPADEWRAFVLLQCQHGPGVPLSRIVTKLQRAEHLHAELSRFSCSATESNEVGLPEFGVEACVFTFLSDLEKQGAVVCLPSGNWRLLVDLPEQQPFSSERRPGLLRKPDYMAMRHQEMEASLQRIVSKLELTERAEFAEGIGAWWKRPLIDGRLTPLVIIKAGDYRWTRLKQQLAAVELALNSDEPDPFNPIGLPMSAAAAVWAAKVADDENERARLRCEKLQARAVQKFGPGIAPMWLLTRPSRRGLSPLEFARASEIGLQDALRELERRFVSTDRIPMIQEEFKVWVGRKFRGKGLRFIQTKNDWLPDRRTPLECCYDDVSRVQMQKLVEERF